MAETWTTSSPRAAELSDVEYELADKIEPVLEARAGEWLVPSRIARLVHEDLAHVRPVLDWLVVHQYIRHDGRSYGIRRFSSR